MIEQIRIDYDLIEVLDGKCLKLSSRQFIKTPLVDEERGKVTPRFFKPYKVSGREDGGYFASSVLNSFPEVYERVNFLNKFYQCLLYGQLPHKAKKLLVYGDSDSGKSSWARLFFGLISQSNIASITKEKSFGCSMLNEATELIFIDEWNSKTMSADTAKQLIQGGWFIQSVKYQTGKSISNNAGIYLTCNSLPDFGDDQQHILKRLAVFETKSLENPALEAPQWIEDHAMECLVWLINEINRNSEHLQVEERFYEKKHDECVNIRSRLPISANEMQKMKAFKFTITDEVSAGVPVSEEINKQFTAVANELNNDVRTDQAGPSTSATQSDKLVIETVEIRRNNQLVSDKTICKYLSTSRVGYFLDLYTDFFFRA